MGKEQVQPTAPLGAPKNVPSCQYDADSRQYKLQSGVDRAMKGMNTLKPCIDDQQTKDQKLIAQLLNKSPSAVKDCSLSTDVKSGDPEFKEYRPLLFANNVSEKDRGEVVRIVTVTDSNNGKNLPFVYLLTKYDTVVKVISMPESATVESFLHGFENKPLSLSAEEILAIKDTAMNELNDYVRRNGGSISFLDHLKKSAVVKTSMQDRDTFWSVFEDDANTANGERGEMKVATLVSVDLNPGECSPIPHTWKLETYPLHVVIGLDVNNDVVDIRLDRKEDTKN